jgi:hypothetical protein
MTRTIEPLKVVLHPTEVLRQVEIMTPDTWGTSPAEVEGAWKIDEVARKMGVPLYLLGWPDGVRVALTTLLPPGITAWKRGIVKAYLARARGKCGTARSSEL